MRYLIFWKIRDVTDIEQMSHKWKNRRWSDDQISSDGLNMCSSANRRRWTIAGSMLTHPLRRSTNIEPAMNQRLVFSGRGYTCIITNQFTIDTRVSWRSFTGGASLRKFGKFPLRPPQKKYTFSLSSFVLPSPPPPFKLREVLFKTLESAGNPVHYQILNDEMNLMSDQTNIWYLSR